MKAALQLEEYPAAARPDQAQDETSAKLFGKRASSAALSGIAGKMGRNLVCWGMAKKHEILAGDDLDGARQRRLTAAHLQAIEGSPPTAEQTAMFEMFEREGWSHDRRVAYIRERAAAAAMIHAAE